MAKSQIIKELANGRINVEIALKRTKVLISELNCPEIKAWINYELSGYPDNVKLPVYRKCYGMLIGSYFKGSISNLIKYNNVPISLGKMPKEERDTMLLIQFTESIGALYELSNNTRKEKQQIGRAIPAEMYPFIAMYNDDMYMNITAVRVIVGNHKIDEIFSAVENKLLDTLLLLEKEFGNLDELDIDLTIKTSEEIDNVIKEMNIIIFNDNSITIGDDNKIKDAEISTEL